MTQSPYATERKARVRAGERGSSACRWIVRIVPAAPNPVSATDTTRYVKWFHIMIAKTRVSAISTSSTDPARMKIPQYKDAARTRGEFTIGGA